MLKLSRKTWKKIFIIGSLIMLSILSPLIRHLPDIWQYGHPFRHALQVPMQTIKEGVTRVTEEQTFDVSTPVAVITNVATNVDNLGYRVASLDESYNAQPGIERAITVDDKGISFDIYRPGQYLYIDLREDGTKFVVRDHETDVLTIDNDKNIITHYGSTLDIRGSLKASGSVGELNQVLTSQSGRQPPKWQSVGSLIAGKLFGKNEVTWDLPESDGNEDQVLTTDGDGTLSWTDDGSGGSGTFNSFTLSGDAGSSQTITDGDTLTVTGGADIDTTAGATDTITIALESTIDTVSIINLSGTGTLNGLDGIDSTTETTLEGALDIGGDISGTGLNSVVIGADKVLESHLKAVDSAADEECLTYETTTGDFEWQSCAAASMTSFTVAGTSGSNQTITDGDTLTLAAGSGITTTGGATDTITIASTLGTSVDLTSEVTGTLPVGNGGTGATTFTTNGLLYGNSTSAIQVTSAGTSGQLLVADGSGVPTFVTLGTDATLSSTGALTISANAVALTTDTTGNYVANVTGGNGIAVSGSVGEGWTPDVTVDILDSADSTGATSSNSGMEFQGASNDELTLLQGCADTQILKWNNGSSVWECAADTTGGGASSFTLAGSAGTPQTLTDGDTITIAAGTGITTTAGATDTVTIAATLGTSISNSEIDADTIDWDRIVDATNLDAATSITGTAGEVLSLSRTLTDATDENGMTISVTAQDTTSGTTAQYGVSLTNAASTEGLDALLYLNNADADDSVADGIRIQSGAGTILTGLDFDDTDIVTDIELQNGEAIHNDTDGTVAVTDGTNTLLSIVDDGTTGTLNVNTVTLTGTGTLNGVDAIDATTETTFEAALDIAGDVSGTGLGNVLIGADKVLESHLKAVDAAGDEECLTYETTTGDFEWQSCAAASMTSFTLAGTSGSNQTITDGDTLTIAAGTGITTTGGATDTVTVASTLGTSVSNSEIDADTIDWDRIVDASALDAATSITGTAGEVLSLSRTLTDATDENGMTISVTAQDTSSGTTAQYGVSLSNAASTEGLDALLYLNNADADDSVADGIRIQSGAGTILTGLDFDDTDIVTDIELQNGETIDNNTDGTIAFTDGSNTLLSIVDDGTSATVSFNTLTLTGTGTLNGVDAIDATTETTFEAALDIAGDVSGTGLGNVLIGADKVLESHLKVVDAAGDEECLTYETTTGDFEWESCTETGATLFTLAGTSGDNQTITAGDTVTIAAGTGITTTGGATDTVTVAATLGTSIANSEIDADTIDWDSIVDASSLDAATSITGTAGEVLTLNRTLTSGSDENGMTISITAQDPSGATTAQYGLSLTNAASTEGADALLYINNADADDSVADGIRIQSGAGTILTGLDFDDTDIVTDIELQNDETIDNNTDGTILLTAPTTSLTGDLIVQGGDITGANSASIDVGEATSGAITFTGGSAGDFVFTLDADTNAQFTASAAPGVDMVAITNSGQATGTNGVDGLAIVLDQLDDGAVDTNSGINLTVTGSGDTDAADTLRGINITAAGIAGGNLIGLNIAGITADAGTETALVIGSGWDTGLSVASAASFTSNVTLGDAAADTITATGTIQGASPFTFEGATDDGIETIFAITDPDSADKTITFPNATGTVAVSASSPLALSALGNLTCTSCLTSTGGNAFAITLAGTSGENQTISQSDTISILAGTGITTTAQATDSVVIAAMLGTSIAAAEVDNDALDFAQFQDTMDLDAALTLNQDANAWSQNFTGSTGAGFTYTATSLGSGAAFVVNATNGLTTNTAVQQIGFNLTNSQGTTANTDFNGLAINFTNNPTVAGNTETAVRIQNQASNNTTDNAVASLLTLDNADSSNSGSTVVTDALRIINSGDIAGGITNAINIDDTDVTTDIVLQNDETIDNNTDGLVFVGGRMAVNFSSSGAILSALETNASAVGTEVFAIGADAVGAGGRIASIATDEAVSSTKFFLVMHSEQDGGGAGIDVEFDFTTDGIGQADTSFTGGGADLAEYFRTTTPGLPKGTLIAIDRTSKQSVKAAGIGDVMIGVVSTLPGLVANSGGADDTYRRANDSQYTLVGLVGQIPTRVTLEGGPITAGDGIALSSGPGVGRKAVPGEQIVGVAMEGYTGGGEGKIMVYVGHQSLASASTFNALAQKINDVESKMEDVAETEPTVAIADTVPASTPVPTPVTYDPYRLLDNDLIFTGVLAMQKDVTIHGKVVIKNDITITGTVFADAIQVAKTLSVLGDTTLLGSLNVGGELSISNQQGGAGVIPRGGKEFTVKYPKAFTKAPQVQVSPTSVVGQYWVSNQTADGFTVVLSDLAQTEVRFNWLTLSIEAPNTTLGTVIDDNHNGVPDIDETHTTEESEPDTVQAGMLPLSITPEVTPEPTPELIGEPSLPPSISPTPL